MITTDQMIEENLLQDQIGFLQAAIIVEIQGHPNHLMTEDTKIEIQEVQEEADLRIQCHHQLYLNLPDSHFILKLSVSNHFSNLNLNTRLTVRISIARQKLEI